MNWCKRAVFSVVLMAAASGAQAQAQSGISAMVNGSGVTVDGVAAADGSRIFVQPGARIVSTGGEVMVNHVKCRVRVRPGASYTVMENVDACKLAGITRQEPAPRAKWWPYAAFGVVAAAAAIGSSDNSDDVASSP